MINNLTELDANVEREARFRGKAMAFLQENGVHPYNPEYRELLDIYIKEAELAYQQSLGVQVT